MERAAVKLSKMTIPEGIKLSKGTFMILEEGKMGVVYLIASGKGGTGKSMFAINFGAILAMRKKSVVIIDMDMGLRNIDLYMGLENNVIFDVHDVMSGVCQISQALIKDDRFESLYIMGASPVKEDGSITPLHTRVLCEKLKEVFDYVIIDSPSGIDDGLVIASGGADACVIVTTPEIASVRNADMLDRELVRIGLDRRYVVVNKVSVKLMKSGYNLGISEINSRLSPELAGIIQSDDNIKISTNLGVPIVLKPGTYIRKNFERIADQLLEE